MSAPGDLPLIAWGEALRAARSRRRRLRNRGLALGLLTSLLIATIPLPPPPRLLWNMSKSAPMGLYLVRPGASLSRGDMVAAFAPGPARLLAARRHYLPFNVPLIKRVAAAPGDIVCARGRAVFVNGIRVALRLSHDARGRTLPWWEGCEPLLPGRYLLLMTHAPASFDGRYFGAVGEAEIIGPARPLWVE
jgi:conjugative transfer signal peptidase TraF